MFRVHTDHLGTGRAGTDMAGNVVWEDFHTPFGESLLHPDATDDQGDYTGHIRDKSSGLTYMQARYYDPLIGRFMGEDPMDMLSMEMNPGYFNRYAYVSNDPVNFVDPFGLYQCGSADDVQECSDDIINTVSTIRDAANNSNDSQTNEILDGVADYCGEAGEENGVFINIADLGKDRGAQFESDGNGGGTITLNSDNTDFSTKNGQLRAAGHLVHEGQHGVNGRAGLHSIDISTSTLNESLAYYAQARFAQHHTAQGNNFDRRFVTTEGKIDHNNILNEGVATSVRLSCAQLETC